MFIVVAIFFYCRKAATDIEELRCSILCHFCNFDADTNKVILKISNAPYCLFIYAYTFTRIPRHPMRNSSSSSVCHGNFPQSAYEDYSQ